MSARPKVLHLSSLSLDRGGMEHVILDITQSLSKTYDFDLLATVSDGYRERFREACQGNIYSWGMKRKIAIGKLMDLNQYLTQIKPDLVHLHDARAGLIARPLLKLKKIPSLMTVHLPPYYYQWKRFSAVRQSLYGWGEAVLNHFTPTHTVYVARHTYEYALKKGYSHPKRSHLVTNGIDLSHFIRVNPYKENKEVIICCVARLGPEKNLPLLIQVAATLHQNRHEFSLWLVGDGPELSVLEQMVSKNKLEHRVRFLGKQMDVLKFLQEADIFVLTSLYETHPLAIMEAQAAGLPCVLSDVGDHAEMVSNPQCGFVVAPNDLHGLVSSLEKLIASPDLRIQFGKNARQKALKEHDKDKMIKQYDSIYLSLLQGNV